MATARTITYIATVKSSISSCFTTNSIVEGDLTTIETIALYQGLIDVETKLSGLCLMTTNFGSADLFPEFNPCNSDFATLAATICGLSVNIEDLVL